MNKIEIYYDFIDKIYESKGKYKLKRYIKENEGIDSMALGFFIYQLYNFINNKTSLDIAIRAITIFVAIASCGIFLVQLILNKVLEKETGKAKEERALDELANLAKSLRAKNINTTAELIQKSEVYHKNYKLSLEGVPGIIRERYIELPIYDSYGKEKSASIKEEHIIGTDIYELSPGNPKKEKQYKLAYNM